MAKCLQEAAIRVCRYVLAGRAMGAGMLALAGVILLPPTVTLATTQPWVQARPDGAKLPLDVVQFLAVEWSGHRVIAKEDLDGDMAMCLASRRITDHPGWISGDFNGDGAADFALLLISSDKENPTLTLVAVFRPSGRRPQGVTLDHPRLRRVRGGSKGVAVDVFLTRVGKGVEISETLAVPGSSKSTRIHLQSDAIQLNYFEHSAQVFFWQGDRFQSIWTAD